MQKNSQKTRFVSLTALLLLSVGIVVSSCKKDDNDEPTPNPTITSISPATSFPGEDVIINGKDFSTETSKNEVKFGSVTATIKESSATAIKVTVPTELEEGQAVKIIVTSDGRTSAAYDFTVAVDNSPVLSQLSVEEGYIGDEITLTGKNFGTKPADHTVYFDDTKAEVTSASATELKIKVPELKKGDYKVKVTYGGITTEAKTFTVKQTIVSFTSFSPTTGAYNTLVTLTGENFGDNKDKVMVTVNDIEQTIESITNTTITFKLKKKTFSGKVKVTVTDINGNQEVEHKDEFDYTVSYRVEDFIPELKAGEIAVTSTGDIYALQAEYTGLKYKFHVVKVANGSTSIDTLVAYNDTLFIQDVYINANDEVILSAAIKSAIYKLKGKNSLEKITNIDEGENINGKITGIQSGKLYFTDTEILYEIDGSSKKAITITPKLSNFFLGEVIYNSEGNLYVTEDEGGKLYELTLDGQSSVFSDFSGNVVPLSVVEHPDLGLLMVEGLLLAGGSSFGMINNSKEYVMRVSKTDLGSKEYQRMILSPKGDVILVSKNQGSKIIYIE